jgi:hypothetical protein
LGRLEVVLGHALALKAIHGGKAKSDKIDAGKIASVLRGGLFPQAYVYPQARPASGVRNRTWGEVLAAWTA